MQGQAFLMQLVAGKVEGAIVRDDSNTAFVVSTVHDTNVMYASCMCRVYTAQAYLPGSSLMFCFRHRNWYRCTG